MVRKPEENNGKTRRLLIRAVVALLFAGATVGWLNANHQAAALAEEATTLQSRHVADSVQAVQLTNTIGALIAQHAADSTVIVEASAILETVKARMVAAVNRPPVVDTQYVDRPVEAPPCVVCRAVVDTQYVDRITLQIDTVVHEIQVTTVVAKRRWWEFLVVAGVSSGIGYVIGNSGDDDSSGSGKNKDKEREDH